MEPVRFNSVAAPSSSSSGIVMTGSSVVSKPLVSVPLTVSGKKGGKSKGKINRADVIFSLEKVPPNIRNLGNPDKVYTFTKSFKGSDFNSSTTVDSGFSSTFTATNFPGFTSYSTVFDQYRLHLVEVWLIPKMTFVGGTTQDSGILASAVDYDDSVVPSTLQEVLDYSTCLFSNGANGHYRTFVPHARVDMDVGIGSCPVPEPWLDVATPLVDHHGLKIMWSQTSPALSCQTMFRMTIQFRYSR